MLEVNISTLYSASYVQEIVSLLHCSNLHLHVPILLGDLLKVVVLSQMLQLRLQTLKMSFILLLLVGQLQHLGILGLLFESGQLARDFRVLLLIVNEQKLQRFVEIFGPLVISNDPLVLPLVQKALVFHHLFLQSVMISLKLVTILANVAQIVSKLLALHVQLLQVRVDLGGPRPLHVLDGVSGVRRMPLTRSPFAGPFPA